MPSKSQTIVIFGGTGGIGLATAQRILARSDHLAANVVLFGLEDLPPDIRDAPNFAARFSWIQADVTDAKMRAAIPKFCLQTYGGLDTLIFCAGVINPIERIEKLDIEELKRSFDVNVFGAMAVVRDPTVFSPCFLPKSAFHKG